MKAIEACLSCKILISKHTLHVKKLNRASLTVGPGSGLLVNVSDNSLAAAMFL